MLYTHFIGRIGKDAQTINRKDGKGSFISMDIAVSDYRKGEETTLWVRVRSNRHEKLQKYLTKGKMILVEGVMSAPKIWTDKKGESHVQISVVADNIHFVSVGKKKDNQDDTAKNEDVKETTPAQKEKKDEPLGAPADNPDDLPF